ncbi:hypothetical protein BUALT_Bualt19G0025900 [Buddleja alternifolia]|uniref:Uncharacterized protein n=1 Tax=Buddleja alternifolia TaxID=168488 RepID=A0AAV6W1H6_9LAMI|nr:hypothetical protein BUALT_Bualt19G0025900 [Buddleja alternifolia]
MLDKSKIKMDSSNGVAARTRSRRRLSRDNTGRTQRVFPNRKIKQRNSRNDHYDGDDDDDDDDDFEFLVSESSEHNGLENFGKTSGNSYSSDEVEMISEADFIEDIKRSSSQSEFANSRKHHLAKETKIARKRKSDFGSKKTWRPQQEIEIEYLTEPEFPRKHRSPEKGNEFQRETNDSEDVGGSRTKESTSAYPSTGGRDRSGYSDAKSASIGVESRTRSKSGTTNEQTQVESISFDSSDGSKSSPCDSEESDSVTSTDSEYDDSNDEDFVMDGSDCSDEKELSMSDEEEGEGDSNNEEECLSSSAQVKFQGGRGNVGNNIQEGLKKSGRRKENGLLKSPLDSNEMLIQKKLNEGEDVNGTNNIKNVVFSTKRKELIGNEEECLIRHSQVKFQEARGNICNNVQEGLKKSGRTKENGLLKSPLASNEMMFKQKELNEGKDVDGTNNMKNVISSTKRKEHIQIEEECLTRQSQVEFQEARGDSCNNIQEGFEKSGRRKENGLLESPLDSNEMFGQETLKKGEDVDGTNNMKNVVFSTKRKELIGKEKVLDKFEKNDEQPTKRGCVYPRNSYGFCKSLMDHLLDNESEFGENEENKQSLKSENALPTKFRFEDEIVKPVEKSESELMVEALFDEMNHCYIYGDMDFPCYQNTEKYNAKSCGDETSQYAGDEMSQYARCCKGKHYLVEDEEKGQFCLYCLHVELEAKHIMPPWAQKMYRRGGRRRYYEAEHSPESDGLDLDFERRKNLPDSSNHSTGSVWDVKPGIKQTMYEHQREGLEFLWKNLEGTINLAEMKTARDSSSIGGCIISHAPGTGKTRLTMVFMETYLKVFPSSRPLIIAPASILLTWEEEFKKWDIEFPFHNLNNMEFSGKERKTLLKNLPVGKFMNKNKDSTRMVKICSWDKGQSVLGMSYSLFENLAGEVNASKKTKTPFLVEQVKSLRDILLEKPGLVVLDEGHIPRNQKSNIWKAILKLKTNKRIILSGTPFQNNFEELFNSLRIVRPDTARALAKEKIFAEMINSRGVARQTNYAIEELKIAMSPFVHVHKGTILRESLPGLRDCLILLNPPPLQKSLIERIKVSQNAFKFDHKVALISMHPYLVKTCKSTENENFGVDQKALEASKSNPLEGVKTRFVIELVRLSIARNEKVLVFSQFIEPLKLTKAHLKKTFGWTGEKQILTMQGKMDQKKRQNLINVFNDPDSEAKVLLASTKCCSEGISLVGASRVVLLDVVWNPSVERQAISRAYRLGQKRVVYTYHLMTSGTKEGDKYLRQAEKERLSELVFTSSSNEKRMDKNLETDLKDRILENMLADVKLKDMFEKIHYQPKEHDLIESFAS